MTSGVTMRPLCTYLNVSGVTWAGGRMDGHTGPTGRAEHGVQSGVHHGLHLHGPLHLQQRLHRRHHHEHQRVDGRVQGGFDK